VEQRRSVIVGTAGHIDHGKTTLIRALTGVNTDRLEEEQKRGITIELGFAPLDLDSVHIGFVDVPGHEKFIKNMLAGAGGMDMMLLIVAADESVMPQTREHVEICRLLNIPRAVAAITKTDSADADSVELVSLETQELLEENNFINTTIVPVSAIDGSGLEELRRAIADTVYSLDERTIDAQPRLPIDRVFTMKGHGTVVTGTLISGTLIAGQKLQAFPNETTATIKNIQVHNSSVEEVHAGHRVAINLTNVSTSELDRGQVLALPNSMVPSQIIDIECNMLPSAPCSLESGMRVRVHAGAAEILARAYVQNSNLLEQGKSGLVRLKLESPLACYIGDRIVLRRYSPMSTLGGGIVLDNSPQLFPGKRAESNALLSKLHSFRNNRDRASSAIQIMQRSITELELIQRFGFVESTITHLFQHAVEAGDILKIADSPAEYCSQDFFTSVKGSIVQCLNELHENNPMSTGFQKNLILPQLPKRVSSTMVSFALSKLQDEEILKQQNGKFSLSSHSVKLSGKELKAYDQLETAFISGRFATEVPAKLLQQIDSDHGHQLLELLIERDKIRLIAKDYFLHESVFQTLMNTLRKNDDGSGFSVADFKEWFGLSRKYAIPLMEYLDRQGITYRKGDQRHLN
jgi:selenocysteine-specific elongation factor